MIVVTGTKRSGTSLWMQVLEAAGFAYIGTEFPYAWRDTIGPANPDGFYESLLRQGIYYATNPHPKTGRFLAPAATRHHAVKVFIPGLVKSDLAYLDRVIASIRPWRGFVASLRALYDLEDIALAQMPEGESRLATARADRGTLPLDVEWFFENYALVRDLATRRYPYQLVSYGRLLADPELTVRGVVAFLGQGDAPRGVTVVRQRARAPEPDVETVLLPEEIAVADEFYDTIERGEPISAALIAGLNTAHRALRLRFAPPPTPA